MDMPREAHIDVLIVTGGKTFRHLSGLPATLFARRFTSSRETMIMRMSVGYSLKPLMSA